MEAGKSNLDFEIFLRACDLLGVSSSQVLYTAECYVQIFTRYNWDVLYERIKAPSKDFLHDEARRFWASPGGQGWWRDMRALEVPLLNSDRSGRAAPVFR